MLFDQRNSTKKHLFVRIFICKKNKQISTPCRVQNRDEQNIKINKPLSGSVADLIYFKIKGITNVVDRDPSGYKFIRRIRIFPLVLTKNNFVPKVVQEFFNTVTKMFTITD